MELGWEQGILCFGYLACQYIDCIPGEHRTKEENTTAMGCLTTKSIAKWALVWVL